MAAYPYYEDGIKHYIEVPEETIVCPHCNGDGGWYLDRQREEDWSECDECEGRGEYEFVEKPWASALDDGDITQDEFDTLMAMQHIISLIKRRYGRVRSKIHDYWLSAQAGEITSR